MAHICWPGIPWEAWSHGRWLAGFASQDERLRSWPSSMPGLFGNARPGKGSAVTFGSSGTTACGVHESWESVCGGDRCVAKARRDLRLGWSVSKQVVPAAIQQCEGLV